MSSVSKWSSYDSVILEVVKDEENVNLGYSELARLVLGKSAQYSDVDVLRTYIRRNFSKFRAIPESASIPKIGIYDIETSRVTAKLWWSGKQYVGHEKIIDEAKIISIAWKMLGEDKVHTLVWDENHSDKEMLKTFLEEYNSWDCAIGINSISFDRKWIAARALKYRFDFNNHVKQYDVQKQARSLFRLPGYAMKYLAKFTGVTLKQSHEGIKMWDMIEGGTSEQQAEYLQKMVDYNIGDIITTEELYYAMRKYLKTPFNAGILLDGEHKWACPTTGSLNVEPYSRMTTPAGTIQHVFKSMETEELYKVSHTQYLKYVSEIGETN